MPYPVSDRWKAAIYNSHSPIVRVQALHEVQFGPNPTGGLELDFVSGDVKYVSSADIKATLNLTVPGKHWYDVLPYGVELFTERGIDYGDGTQEYSPLGYFRVHSIKQPDAPDGPITVAASDRGYRLFKKHRVLYPYAYEDGISHREIFERLINGYQTTADEGSTVAFPMFYGKIVPIVFLGYDPDRAFLPAGVVEDNIGEFLAKIADQKGCTLRFARTGELLVDLKTRPPSQAPDFVVKPGAGGSLIAVSRELDDDALSNVMDVTGSDPAHPVGYYYLSNDNPAHPLYYKGPFQATVRKYASPLLQSNEQLEPAARKLFNAHRDLLPSGVGAVMLPDPSIDMLDVISIITGASPEPAVADEITIPLDINTGVTVDTKAQTDATDEIDGSDLPPLSGTFAARFRDQHPHPRVTAAGATQVVNVTNSAQLTAALAGAKAGQVITLADGTYTGSFTLAKKGTSGQPIVVKAANQGKAVLGDGSSLTLNGAEWCLVTGLAAPYDTAGAIFSMLGESKFCRFTRCLVGPAAGPASPVNFTVGVGSCINATNSNALARAATFNLNHWYNAGDSFYKDSSPKQWVADWNSQFSAPGYSALLKSLKPVPGVPAHWVNVSDHESYTNNGGGPAYFPAAFQTAYRQMMAGRYLGGRLLFNDGITQVGVVGRVAFFMQDQRSYRSPATASDGPNKTMLGLKQRKAFFDFIDACDGVFPLVMVLGDVQLHVPTTAGEDHWAGYNYERQLIKAKLDSKPNMRFVYVHGNMHALMKATGANAYGYDLSVGASPLNNDTKVSAGGAGVDASVPQNGSKNGEGQRAEQFGVLTFLDNGKQIGVAFKGYNAAGTHFSQVDASVVVNAPVVARTNPSTASGNYFRISDQCQDCVIDYNELRNKSRPGDGIAVDGDTTVKDNAGGCQHILIAHNYIHDFGTEIPAGFEAVRFGSAALGKTASNSAIIRNVFQNINVGAEVLSLRMGTVDVWGNSILNSCGGIVQRYGQDGLITDNYIVGAASGTAGTKSGGIRAYDAGHQVTYNYLAGLNGDKFTSAIALDGGDAAPGIDGRTPAKAVKAQHNLIVGTQTGIVLGPNYTVPPDALVVTDNLAVANPANTVVQTVKAPTGANTLSPNVYKASVTDAGLTLDEAKLIYQSPGVGPRLKYLTLADIGPDGDTDESDGTGTNIAGAPGDPATGDGGTGTPTGPNTADTPAKLLRIGSPAGWNKVNLGVGFGQTVPKGFEDFKGKHVDFDLAAIQSLPAAGIPGYIGLTADKQRVYMAAWLDGGRTSKNTKYPRTEWRGLAANGKDKQAFNPNANGIAQVLVRNRVTKMPPKKPQLCLAQFHDPDDDTAMVYMTSKTLVQAKDGDTVVGTLTSSFSFSTDYFYGIAVIGDGSKASLAYYWGTTIAAFNKPKLVSPAKKRSSQWYAKAGCYAQSNSGTDNVADGPFIIEMSALQIWQPGMPSPVGFGAFV